MRRFTWVGQFTALLVVVAWLTGCAPAPAAVSSDTAENPPRNPSAVNGSQAAATPTLNDNPVARAQSPAVSTPPAQQGPASAWPQHLNEVVTLPQQLTGTDLDQLVGACLKAANLASSLNSGQATIAGTLRQGADGNYAYEPSPSGALHLIDVNGSSAKFIITALTGNRVNVEDFLQSDHTVQCAITRGIELDLEVASAKAGRQQERRIRGTTTGNGQTLSFDLSTSGSVIRDGDNFSTETHLRTIGEVKFDDVVIHVDEDHAERSVSTLSTQQATVNSEWTEGAARYQLQNMFYDIAFDLNGPSELNTWQAQGILVSSGAPIGQIGLKSTGSTVELLAEGDGGRTVLNSWSK